MPKFKIRAVLSLMIGLILCAICALFPPRQVAGGGSASVPRVLLFNSDIRSDVRKTSNGVSFYPAEIDAGHLFAECILIISLSSIVALYFCLEHWQSQGERIWKE